MHKDTILGILFTRCARVASHMLFTYTPVTLSPNQAEWAQMKNIERYYSVHECRSNLFRMLSECSSNPLWLSFDIVSTSNVPRLFWTCSKHSGWLQEWDRMSWMHSECNTNLTNAFRIDPNALRIYHSNGIWLIRPLVWLGYKSLSGYHVCRKKDVTANDTCLSGAPLVRS